MLASRVTAKTAPMVSKNSLFMALLLLHSNVKSLPCESDHLTFVVDITAIAKLSFT